MKHLRQARKASVVNSGTSSRCTAFTESETGIGLNYNRFPYMPILDVEGASIVHANFIENEIRGDTLNR